jgi:hypothetical protein
VATSNGLDPHDYFTAVVPPSKAKVSLGDKTIPEIDVASIRAREQGELAAELRTLFFDKAGCLILRNVFPAKVRRVLELGVSPHRLRRICVLD